MPHLWQFGVILGCSRALLWHFQMGLKVPIHQSGCIPPRSNQDPGSTTNLGPPGITISSYTHFGQFGPNWGPPGAPQTPKSGPSRKKMWALCSSIITNSIKTNETVSAMKKNHGTNVSKYWLTAHCAIPHPTQIPSNPSHPTYTSIMVLHPSVIVIVFVQRTAVGSA